MAVTSIPIHAAIRARGRDARAFWAIANFHFISKPRGRLYSLDPSFRRGVEHAAHLARNTVPWGIPPAFVRPCTLSRIFWHCGRHRTGAIGTPSRSPRKADLHHMSDHPQRPYRDFGGGLASMSRCPGSGTEGEVRADLAECCDWTRNREWRTCPAVSREGGYPSGPGVNRIATRGSGPTTAPCPTVNPFPIMRLRIRVNRSGGEFLAEPHGRVTAASPSPEREDASGVLTVGGFIRALRRRRWIACPQGPATEGVSPVGGCSPIMPDRGPDPSRRRGIIMAARWRRLTAFRRWPTATNVGRVAKA